MKDAGILDGDMVIVKKQNTANNHDIVVALIENEATVKTFYKESNRIRLQPENPAFEPIYSTDCQILGKSNRSYKNVCLSLKKDIFLLFL